MITGTLTLTSKQLPQICDSVATVRRAHQALNQLAGNTHPAETVTSYLALARPTNTWKLRGSICHRAAQHGLEPDEQRTKVA